MATRLQRDVQRRAAGLTVRLPQGHHLGMVAAGAPMVPRADDLALVHDDRAYRRIRAGLARATPGQRKRSEEHTSELQSRSDLVCRLLLEKKKKEQVHDHNG